MHWFQTFLMDIGPVFDDGWTGDLDEIANVREDGRYNFIDRLRAADFMYGKARMLKNSASAYGRSLRAAAAFLESTPAPEGRIYFLVDAYGGVSVFAVDAAGMTSYESARARWHTDPQEHDRDPFDPTYGGVEEFSGVALHVPHFGAAPSEWTLHRGIWTFPTIGEVAQKMKSFEETEARLSATHTRFSVTPETRFGLPMPVRNIVKAAPPGTKCLALLPHAYVASLR